MEPIQVDAAEAAVIIFNDRRQVPYFTLQEATMDFSKLGDDVKLGAKIRTATGKIFTAAEVQSLQYK